MSPVCKFPSLLNLPCTDLEWPASPFSISLPCVCVCLGGRGQLANQHTQNMEDNLLCSKSPEKGAFEKKFSEDERVSHANTHLGMRNPGRVRSTKALQWECARHVAGVECTRGTVRGQGQNCKGQSVWYLVGLHKYLGLLLNKMMEGTFQQGNDLIQGFTRLLAAVWRIDRRWTRTEAKRPQVRLVQ